MISTRVLLTTLLLALTIVSSAPAATSKTNNDRDRLFQERTYLGKSLTFWLEALRDRDEELISDAFSAIYSLGNDEWIAVPDLSRIVGEPFEPIEIGTDSEETIASKLYDVAIRSEAIEALAWIGEPAAPSTPSLVKWGLMLRVSPDYQRSSQNDELFIELVAMDTEQKMRVAGAVSRLGRNTIPAVAKMLASPDFSKRKLAIAILSQDALPVATELLRSDLCEDKRLGLRIMTDMDLVVSPVYIDELAHQIAEKCGILTKVQ